MNISFWTSSPLSPDNLPPTSDIIVCSNSSTCVIGFPKLFLIPDIAVGMFSPKSPPPPDDSDFARLTSNSCIISFRPLFSPFPLITVNKNLTANIALAHSSSFLTASDTPLRSPIGSFCIVSIIPEDSSITVFIFSPMLVFMSFILSPLSAKNGVFTPCACTFPPPNCLFNSS